MGVKLHAFRAEEEILGLEFSFSAFYEEEEKAKKKNVQMPTCPFSCQQYEDKRSGEV